jgi:hypothetical protein
MNYTPAIKQPPETNGDTQSQYTILQFVKMKGVKSPAETKNAFQAWMRRGEHLPKAINQVHLDENRQNSLTGRTTGLYRTTDLEQAWDHWLSVRRSEH